MRLGLAASLSLLVIGLSAASPASAQKARVCKDGTTSAATGRGACAGHGGVDGKATKALSAPAKVTCTDGSLSKPGRGACSRHGGVKGSATAVVTPVPAPEPTPARAAVAKTAAVAKMSSKGGDNNDPIGAIAQCKDGMYSHAANHRGACSRHKGVAKFLKP